MLRGKSFGNLPMVDSMITRNINAPAGQQYVVPVLGKKKSFEGLRTSRLVALGVMQSQLTSRSLKRDVPTVQFGKMSIDTAITRGTDKLGVDNPHRRWYANSKWYKTLNQARQSIINSLLISVTGSTPAPTLVGNTTIIKKPIQITKATESTVKSNKRPNMSLQADIKLRDGTNVHITTSCLVTMEKTLQQLRSFH